MQDTNTPQSIEVLDLTRRRVQFFWFFNVSFWLFIALNNFAANPGIATEARSLVFLLLHTLVGILQTYLLHTLIYERFTLARMPIAMLVLLVLACSIGFAVMRVFCRWALSYLLFGQVPPLVNPSFILADMFRASFNFVAWSGIYFSFKMHERLSLQRQEARQARLMAQSAQLEVLRYQLNPHFLFNTLSSLRALTTRNPQKANEVVAKISEFLRYSLFEGKEDQVPLSEEIKIIHHYLDIERIQYGKKLVVNVSTDPLAEDYPIPVFLIHPLVENAVKHGMRSSLPPLIVSVLAARTEHGLRISVTNSGQWITPQETSPTNGTGTGLANVQKRLQHFFPGRHHFEIRETRSSVEVVIHLRKEYQRGQSREI